MFLAQEIENATSHSDMFTLVVSVGTAIGFSLREIVTYLRKQERREERNELLRQLDTINAKIAIALENKLRIEELGRGMDADRKRLERVAQHSQEVRDIVVAVRAIVDSWGVK